MSSKKPSKITAKEFLPSQTEPIAHNMSAELANIEPAKKYTENEVEGQKLSFRQKKRNAAKKRHPIAMRDHINASDPVACCLAQTGDAVTNRVALHTRCGQ